MGIKRKGFEIGLPGPILFCCLCRRRATMAVADAVNEKTLHLWRVFS
jgi:hypothetical protein